MSYLISLLLLVIFFNQAIATNLCSKGYREDELRKYYIGISDGLTSLDKAKEVAKNNAQAEALRHNFNHQTKIGQSLYSVNDRIEAITDSSGELPTVRMAGLIVHDTYIERNNNGTYLVCTQISYSKTDLAKAIIEQAQSIGQDNSYGTRDLPNKVTIRTIPEGATIALSSLEVKYSKLGSSPALFWAPMGKLRVTATLEGHYATQRDIIASGDQQEIVLEMRKFTGKLYVTPDPIDAKIKIDGKAINEFPIELEGEREYTIEAEHQDYHHQSSKILIPAGEVIEHQLKLTPKNGSIRIVTSPVSAKIMIGSKDCGMSPTNEIILAPGTYQVSAVFGKHVQITEFTIEANKSAGDLLIERKLTTLQKFRDLIDEPQEEKEVEEPEKTDELELATLNLHYNSRRPVNFGMELFAYKNLSLYGGWAREEWEEKQGDFTFNYDTKLWIFGPKLYLYRSKYFSLGTSVAYQRLHTRCTAEWKNKENIITHDQNGWSYGAHATIPLRFIYHRLDLQLQYEKSTIKSEDQNRLFVGISIGF